MSAVYKVMQQMQRTQPRRLRGNRPVMIVLGVIVIIGMLLILSELSQQPAITPTAKPSTHQPQIKMGVADQAEFTQDHALGITVSLNQDDQWEVADHGVVTEEELRGMLEMKRAQAEEQGLKAVLRARIAGDQSAKHFIELHRLAEDCGMDEIKIAAHAKDLEGWDE